MFQKVHLKLTLLCAGITIFILLVMSCGWLYVSEKSLRDNSFISFQNDMNTLISNLEKQTVISGEWLKIMEDNGKYLIWILDNGVPFLHNRQNQSPQSLYESAWASCKSKLSAIRGAASSSTVHTELPFRFEETGTDYYACGAVLSRGQGELQTLILAPLAPLESQIE